VGAEYATGLVTLIQFLTFIAIVNIANVRINLFSTIGIILELILFVATSYLNKIVIDRITDQQITSWRNDSESRRSLKGLVIVFYVVGVITVSYVLR
jgi:hypothetical protein